MELHQAIRDRFSYRGAFREDRPVEREALRRIVEAGLLAPSGKNEQTTRFVIIDEAEKIAALRAIHEGNRAMQTARAFIACIVSKNPEAIYEGYSFEVEDCAAAVENMLLAVTAEGLATVWIDGWLRVEGRAEQVGSLIGLTGDKIVRILLPLGVPAEENPRRPEKLPFEARAWFNQYGG